MKWKLKWFYKGMKIHKWHRKILWKIRAVVVVFPALITLAVQLWLHEFQISQEILIQSAIKSAIIGVILSVVISLLLFRAWSHIYNLQKLCQMCFDAMYYNLEGKQSGGKIVNSQKSMTYFPKMYYHCKKGVMKITIKLDGSKFHEGFTDMGNTLGEMFDREVTGENRKYWYKIYTLEAIEEDRLYMGKREQECEKAKMPLMKGLWWNFKKAPHALITGVTGGGKSYFLYYIIRCLKKLGAKLYIIDPKRSDLYGLRKVLEEDEVAYATGKVMQMCRKIMAEMDKRYEQLDEAPFGADYETLGLKPIFLIFDEFIAFIESLERKEDVNNIMSYLTKIVLEGRQAGIQIIFATQRADAKYLSGAIRDNLGLRVSLGSLEKSGYRMTFGDADKKFEKFGSSHGYVYVNGETETIREFYAPYLGREYDPMKDLEDIVNAQAKSPVELRSRSSGSDEGDGARAEDEVRQSEE